jgi:hypothetical protein
VVLCDLEGKPRREAARRLAKCGLTLSGGALAAALAEGASAAVPAPWVGATAKAAALVAAGRAAATPATLLMNEVLRAMLVTKLKLVAVAALAVVLLGAGGVAFRAAGQAPGGGSRPLTDLEVLRREVQILKLQVELLQNKVHAQEVALRALQRRGGPAGAGAPQRSPSELNDARWRFGDRKDTKARPEAPLAYPKPAAGPDKVPADNPLDYPKPRADTDKAPLDGGLPRQPAHGPANATDKPAPGPEKPLGRFGGPNNFPRRPGPLASGRTAPAGPEVPLDPKAVPPEKLPAGDRADPTGAPAPRDPVREAEAALRRLREARDDAARRRAADALQRALRRLGPLLEEFRSRHPDNEKVR